MVEETDTAIIQAKLIMKLKCSLNFFHNILISAGNGVEDSPDVSCNC